MLPKLTEAEYGGEYRIRLKFADGAEGEVDFKDELWGEVFEPLKEEKFFANFSLHKELGTIVWANGADFAPEYLYQKLRPHYSLRQKINTNAA
jgi:hypothetical protein